MQSNFLKIPSLSIGTCILIACSVPSIQAEEAGSIGLEEVLVTAQKREQNIQDIPISISSFSRDDIEARVMTELEDLNTSVPNLVLAGNDFVGEAEAQAYIRGLPGVGIYIDDVYQSSSNGLLTRDLAGVERINVLRGPQGTLFGKETSGGAIQIYTQEPADEFGGSVKYGRGSGNLSDFNVFVDLPITDTLKTRFTATSVDRDGYVKNVVGGPDAGDINNQAFSVDLFWTPIDTFEARLKYGENDFTQDAIARVLVETETINTGDFENQANQFSDTWLQDYEDVSLHLAWDVTDNITIKSITAYIESDYGFFIDHDGTKIGSPFESSIQFEQSQRGYSENKAQEFQIIGRHDKLDWVAGTYLWEEDVMSTDRTLLQLPGLPQPILFNRNGLKGEQIEGYAFFGDASYAITERWSVSFGARYSDEDKTNSSYIEANSEYLDPSEFAVTSSNYLLKDDGLISSVKASYDNVSIKAAVNYQVIEDTMVYGSYSEGFTSGGAYLAIEDWDDNLATPATSRTLSYDPEEVESVEFGVKSEWLKGSLRANASIFFMDYSGIQVGSQLRRDDGSLIQGATGTANVAEGEVKGLELDVNYFINENWNAQFSYGYTDAEYTDVGDSLDFRVNTPFERTPENSFNLSLNNSIDLADKGYLRSSMTYGWKDKMAMSQTINQLYVQDDYGLLSARVTLNSASKRWSLSAYGSNLTDEAYYTGALSSDTIGSTLASIARGRECGIELKVNF